MDIGPFQRAAGAGAQLLKVDRLPLYAGADDGRAAALLLTFDVGRVLVSADAPTRRLDVVHVADAEALPGGLVAASEDEPWWRLLGSPLARAARGDRATTLRLGFRVAGARLREVGVALDGAEVRAAIEARG